MRSKMSEWCHQYYDVKRYILHTKLTTILKIFELVKMFVFYFQFDSK